MPISESLPPSLPRYLTASIYDVRERCRGNMGGIKAALICQIGHHNSGQPHFDLT